LQGGLGCHEHKCRNAKSCKLSAQKGKLRAMQLPSLKSQCFQELVVASIALAAGGISYVLFHTLGHWVIIQIYSGTLPFEAINQYLEYANHIFSVGACRASVVLLFLIFIRYHGSKLLKSTNLTSDYLSPALLIGLVLLAWSNRFIQDDAFISFRYAANLIHGYGLTWNPGEPRIEGYTNPLWTLLMTIPIALGRDPILFSWILGTLCFTVTLVFTYLTALLVLQCSIASSLVVLLLGTNYTFSAYATGGLETQLQTALLVTAQFSHSPYYMYLSLGNCLNLTTPSAPSSRMHQHCCIPVP